MGNDDRTEELMIWEGLSLLRRGLLGFLDASLRTQVQRILLIDGPGGAGLAEVARIMSVKFARCRS